VVLLGPAWEALLFFAPLSLIGSLAAGLAVLLALERDTPRRNVAACVLLVCSVSLGNLGIPFVVAAVVAIGLRRRPAELWIPAVPALLFGLWWVLYGSDAPSSLSASNLVDLPLYMLRSAASGLASIVGLNRGTDADRYLRGYVVLALAAVVILAWLRRGGRPSSGVWVFASAAVSFWALTGASYIVGREPLASRYQIVDAALLILIAAELFRPLRLRPAPAAAVAAVAVFALASNVDTLLGYGYGFMREQAAYVKAELGALELARGVTPSDLQLVEAVARNPYLSGVTAGRYFAQTSAHGSPASYSPAQIATAPQRQRRAADGVLASAYGVQPVAARAPLAAMGCRRLRAGTRFSAETALPDPGVLIGNPGTGRLVIGVRRFGPRGLYASVGFVGPRSSARVRVRADALGRPWQLSARTASRTRSTIEVCPLRAARRR
jgi:hypothetical protein